MGSVNRREYAEREGARLDKEAGCGRKRDLIDEGQKHACMDHTTE